MTFRRNHRIVFGGLIAALSAAVILAGAAVWQVAGTGSSVTAVEPVAAPAAVPAVDTTSRSMTPVHYYLVNSQAQADALAQAYFEAQMSYSGLGTFTESLRVIDVSTSGGQAALASLDAGIAEDTLNGGVGVTIVDLTAGTGFANTSSGSSFVPDAADAVYAGETLRAAEAVTVVDPHFGTGVESVSAIEGDYLGIGQPGEGVTSVEATLIDPTDFGSMGMAYELAQNRPRASAALPAEGSLEANYSLPTSFPLVQEMSHPQVAPALAYPLEAAIDYSLPTTFAADFFGAGQPGEGSEVEGAMFGTMVDAVYVIESEMQLP